MTAVFKREFKAYFTGPIGYVVLLFLFFLTGVIFAEMYSAGYPYIDYIFSSSAIWAALITPIITMRLFSEERRNKTDQALFAAPVKISEIMFGKYFAALAVFAIGFAPTLIYQIIISSIISSNWLSYILSLFGMILFGGAMIAMGCFISSVTESQAVAAIVGYAATIVLIIADSLSSLITASWFSKIGDIISKYSIIAKLEPFNTEILSPGSIVYFVSFIALFLFFTTLSLNKRRWK